MVYIANKVFFHSYQINSSWKNLLGNWKAMANLIWSKIETIFWVWCLIFEFYQLLNITTFYHHKIYYDNIITNLMTSLILTNSYKSIILNYNSWHEHIPNYHILGPSRIFYKFLEPFRYLLNLLQSFRKFHILLEASLDF